jgi:hypothetical protein
MRVGRLVLPRIGALMGFGLCPNGLHTATAWISERAEG